MVFDTAQTSMLLELTSSGFWSNTQIVFTNYIFWKKTHTSDNAGQGNNAPRAWVYGLLMMLKVKLIIT